jgi:uncharacterized protein YxeA
VEGTSPNTNRFRLSRAGKPFFIYLKDLKFCPRAEFFCAKFTMKNKKIIILSIIILIFLGLFFLIPHKNLKQGNNLVKNTPVINLSAQTQTIQTTLNINGVSYKDEITEKISVYDFMSELQTEGKINFTEKNYIGMGKFIDSINGIKNNNNMSWIYYVNGKEAQVGVSNYKINPGDVVSWKYEKSDY